MLGDFVLLVKRMSLPRSVLFEQVNGRQLLHRLLPGFVKKRVSPVLGAPFRLI